MQPIEPRHISATEARIHFGSLLEAVKGGETVIVERNGREAVVFVPIAEYHRMKQRQEQRAALAESMARMNKAVVPQSKDGEVNGQ